MAEYFLLWQGADELRLEAARVRLESGGIRARGVQLGVAPLAYRVDYEVETDDQLVTRHAAVWASGDGWSRKLELHRDPGGGWRCAASHTGDAALAEPGGDAASLAGADDCDLASSPLFNTMPALRTGLLDHQGAADFTMAWIGVPDLAVEPSPQRYEHLRPGTVRFTSEDFHADIDYDGLGLVVDYPQVARRVYPSAEANPTRQLG